MRVLLVGSPEERARVRSQSGRRLEIVGEFPTIEAARAADADAAAILVAPAGAADAAPPRAGERNPGGRPSRFGRGRNAAVDDVDDAPAQPLTRREIDVLGLLAEGLPNKAIAERLGISDQTVKFHVGSISGKLGAANRTDVVRRAVRRGLIDL